MRIINHTTDKNGIDTYKIKTRIGVLGVRGIKPNLPRNQALMVAKREVQIAQEGMTFIEKIIFQRADKLAKAQDVAIIKAFDLPAWVVIIPPRIFALIAKILRYKIVHKPDVVEFYKSGEKVAELEMIKRFMPGKFKKL